MKKRTLLLAFIMILSLLANSYADENDTKLDNKDKDFRGVWVASVVNIDYPRRASTNPALLKIEADNIIESASNQGFNAIFLQVRPTADSLYKSDIFPWSKYLTGKEGLAPKNGFDPLEYFIEEAHKRNIEVHAWINPYRITKKKWDEKDYTIDMLTKNHPARKHPNYVVSYKGNLYFDPALPQVRNLIAKGVREIIQNYDVDGIHFDDYFYPGTDFDDEKSYKRYGRGKDKGDWRRDNVNKLIKQIYSEVHRSNKDIVFGVSPFGIWANEESLASGSKTRGNQSYFAHYADSLYWIDHSIIDYIAPQIYWHEGKKVADFKILTDWWADKVKYSKVKLYIGLAAYKADNTDKKSPWYGNDELKRQIKYVENKENVDGFIAFSIRSTKDSNKVYNAFRGKGEYKYRGDKVLNGIKIYGGYGKQYVAGVIDPSKEAYLNGKKIENVSDKGFFGIFIDNNSKSKYGKNVFVLSQEGFKDKKVYTPPKPWKPSKPKKQPNNKHLNNILNSGGRIYAQIRDEEADLRVQVNPRRGSQEKVKKDVMDKIVAFEGNMIKLSSDRYIESSKARLIFSPTINLYQPRYADCEGQSKISFKSNRRPFMKAYLEGNNLILDISEDIELPKIWIPRNAFVKSYKIEERKGRNAYVFELRDINKLGGYFVDIVDDRIVLTMNHKKFISDSDEALKGFNIILDPGHGGRDNGATGLLGKAYTEKDFNLDITLKLAKRLEKLGANVILTRDKDEEVSLDDRLQLVYKHNPDMFISIHANSCLSNKDISKIEGFSVYYSEDIAKNYANLAQKSIYLNSACTNKDTRTANFYVIRATHCPSVLLELGFMPNPSDFDWLSDDKKQDELAGEIARTILMYFEK